MQGAEWMTAIGTLLTFFWMVWATSIVWPLREKAKQNERLEGKLAELVTKLVKAEFEKETNGLRSSVENLNATIARCVERIDDGDDDFKDFVQKSIEQRIEQMTLVAEMSGKMTERLADLTAKVNLLMGEGRGHRQ